MNALPYVGRMALALTCFVFTAWSAPITYPNQAYLLSGETFSGLPGAANVKAIAVEDTMVLAVTRDGRVVGYGLPELWRRGGVLEQLTNVVAVGLNYTMAAALTADGRIIEFGRYGLETSTPLSGLTNVIAIDVTGQYGDDDLDYKIAVTSDGRVLTWGYFGYPPSADVPGVVTAAGGWSHIVALKSDGTVVQWSTEGGPEPVPGLNNVVAVAAGGMHSVALKADGTVVAWGENYYGQLNVPAGLANVVAIAASEEHTLALKGDGTLVAWGAGVYGGNATAPSNLSNVVVIACSGTKNAAICENDEFRITSLRVTDGSVTLSWRSQLGKTYYVDYKSALTNADWTPVSGGIIAQGKEASWTGLRPAGSTAFYRAVRLAN